MEFRRPRWDEHPDRDLVRRHERQLFPLLHRRRLFADVENFLLYDFYLADGSVDENVFAYSNRHGDERSLVLYHNSYADTRGWIRTSAAVADGSGVTQRGLGDGLGVDSEPGSYVIFLDAVTGLEYLRPCDELHRGGLYAELAAYQLHVFVDIREVEDDDESRYGGLHRHLEGRGVPSITDALAELELAPVLGVFERWLEEDAVRRLAGCRSGAAGEEFREPVLDRIRVEATAVLEAAGEVADRRLDGAAAAGAIRDELMTALDLPGMSSVGGTDQGVPDAAAGLWQSLTAGEPGPWAALLVWIAARHLDAAMIDRGPGAVERSRFDEFYVSKVLERALADLEMDTEAARNVVAGVRLMLACGGWHLSAGSPLPDLRGLVKEIFDDERLQEDLGVNRYDGVLWFRNEAFDNALGWLWMLAAVETAGDPEAMGEAERQLAILAKAKEASGYRVDDLLAALDVGRD